MRIRPTDRRAFAPTPLARAAVKHSALALVLFLAVGGLTAFIADTEVPTWVRFAIYAFGGMALLCGWAGAAEHINHTYEKETSA